MVSSHTWPDVDYMWRSKSAAERRWASSTSLLLPFLTMEAQVIVIILVSWQIRIIIEETAYLLGSPVLIKKKQAHGSTYYCRRWCHSSCCISALHPCHMLADIPQLRSREISQQCATDSYVVLYPFCPSVESEEWARLCGDRRASGSVAVKARTLQQQPRRLSKEPS